MKAKLEELLSVAEVTKMANEVAKTKVSPRRMKYRLKKIDAAHPGLIRRLAEDPKGKIFVTRSALKKAAPYLFEVGQDLGDEAEQMRRQVNKLERKVDAMAEAIASLNAFRKRASGQLW